MPRPVNQVWLTDVTEHRADEGKLYLCAIKDVYSNRIVGYSIDSRMKASLAVAALDHAIATRSPVDRFNLVDFAHGSSYIHCRTMGYADQMGPVGARGENAAMESFFALLQRYVLDRIAPHTRRKSTVVGAVPLAIVPGSGLKRRARSLSSSELRLEIFAVPGRPLE